MERAWQVPEDEQILMLAVNVGEDEDRVFTFTADYPVTFPLLLDKYSEVTARWSIRGLPTTFVIDPVGHIAYRAIGGRVWDEQSLLEPVRALTARDEGDGH